MKTVLLASGGDDGGGAVTLYDCGIRERLAARLCSSGLDRKLADGADPDSSAALSLRATALLSNKVRVGLARGLRRLLRSASERPPHPLRSGVPVARRQITGQRERLAELVELLEGPGVVEACGVARVELLLREADSPLYLPSQTSGEPLRQALDDALAGLRYRSRAISSG